MVSPRNSCFNNQYENVTSRKVGSGSLMKGSFSERLVKKKINDFADDEHMGWNPNLNLMKNYLIKNLSGSGSKLIENESSSLEAYNTYLLGNERKYGKSNNTANGDIENSDLLACIASLLVDKSKCSVGLKKKATDRNFNVKVRSKTEDHNQKV